MNVGRACKDGSRSLFWKCCFFIYLSILIFWLLFLQVVREAWCCISDMLCPAWEPESLSPPPPPPLLLLLLLLHLLWWSYCIRTALVSFRVEATETVDGFMALLWRDRASEERITGAVAECCRCLWRQRRIDAKNALDYFQFCCWSFFHPVRDGHAGLRRIRVCAFLSVPQYPKPHAQVQEVRQFISFKSAWNESSICFWNACYCEHFIHACFIFHVLTL